ncbi:MAG: hypothetical protein RL375_3132 [Pseudomonadota bacterium]
MSLVVATLRRMPSPDSPAHRDPPALRSDDFFPPDPDLPEQGVGRLADLVAASLGLFVTALALLMACGWLATGWGAALLGGLLICPLAVVLTVLLWP